MTSARDSLRHILDGAVTAQKRDIHDITGGHLNHGNLWKHPEKTKHKTWTTASNIGSTNTQKKKKKLKPMKQVEGMKDTLTSFSLGNIASISDPSNLHQQRAQSSEKMKRRHAGDQSVLKRTNSLGPIVAPPSSVYSLNDDSKLRDDIYEQTRDGTFIQELDLPDVMVPSSTRITGRVTKFIESQREQARHRFPQTDSNDLYKVQHHFVPGFMDAVTKADQYSSLKTFQKEYIRMQDVTEQQVMSGNKAVEDLEDKLLKELQALDQEGVSPGPNYEHLQVYSSGWEELIERSTTFGFILRKIKETYDAYLARLLDSHPMRHQVLYQQLETLAEKNNGESIVKKEQQKLVFLETEAKNAIAENERLKKLLKEEQEIDSREVVVDYTPESHQVNEPAKDVVSRVTVLSEDILKNLDEKKELHDVMRKELVPRSVVMHLEACVKETEVGIQKLNSQKDFYEKSIAELEKELQEVIETADTTEKDARLIRACLEESGCSQSEQSRESHIG